MIFTQERDTQTNKNLPLTTFINPNQMTNYPTPTDIFTRLSELSEKTLKDNEAVFQQVKKDWDSVGLKYTSEGLRTVIREDSLIDADLDEVVFDVISEWDEKFEGDTDWFDEDDSDMKDSLRDYVMNIIEEQDVELVEINREFLKDESVIEVLKTGNYSSTPDRQKTPPKGTGNANTITTLLWTPKFNFLKNYANSELQVIHYKTVISSKMIGSLD